ncbi:hypothetical protein [Beggiatoa leptomitoformis]|uniref:Uncharacterized protein n=1 Tax=Beggiatoa leptomitoformis TaxID=288004 RepID=A0A2N9YIR9_9GAMM|nr:hypothetical protein [Beggiatoa leptomitoformis]ALG67474.2 hypothetical protein AL038_06845 [Beggiatoa leptomitoformis]AUI70309.2 hypothetical protein BLE401_17460 [Beggiatoa leptomitoformis]
MEIDKALNQLAEIHAHLSRTEFYRGLRALPVALTAFSALFAAALQSIWLDKNPYYFLMLWVSVAIVNILLTLGLLAHRYYHHQTVLAREKDHAMFLQFAPTLFAGGLVSLVAGQVGEELIRYLPALWCLIFGLGVFACRPYLPFKIFWAGTYYLFAATLLFMQATTGDSLQPFSMGLAFGIGQLCIAGILYWDLERHS